MTLPVAHPHGRGQSHHLARSILLHNAGLHQLGYKMRGAPVDDGHFGSVQGDKTIIDLHTPQRRHQVLNGEYRSRLRTDFRAPQGAFYISYARRHARFVGQVVTLKHYSAIGRSRLNMHRAPHTVMNAHTGDSKGMGD